MTQELNKEGLASARIAYEDDAGYVHDDALYDAIQAYLNHPKVTGFEPVINSLKITAGKDPWEKQAIETLEAMQAALAGGNTK